MQALEELQPEIIYDHEFYYRLAHPHYSPEENNYQRPSCQYQGTQTSNLFDGTAALHTNDPITLHDMDSPILNDHENNGWWQPIGVQTVSSTTETQINTEQTCFGMPSIANSDVSQGNMPLPYQFMPLAQASNPPKTFVKPSMRAPKLKRVRTAFTTAQLEYLERYFRERPYVSAADRLALTMQLGVTDKIIKTWFQNRRFKAKTEALEAVTACNQLST